jgi:4-amino-4-deoxy-L-arabinose transferase-like glycosyltransferase
MDMDFQRTERPGAASQRRVWTGSRHRLLTVVLLVAALALWTLGRSSWTPDEPREWGIASEALAGQGLVVPTLSGERFVEKPPLTYWAGAASMAVFGPTVAAARAPNLVWALVSILSVAACAAALVPAPRRREAAWLAALVLPTMLLAFKRLSWLATDAPMMAGVSLALAGLYGAVHAASLRRRVLAGIAFGAGCALAFLAKNAWGALVPAACALCYLAWTSRLDRERLTTLLPGIAVAAAAIGAWLVAVACEPNGLDLLREFLWDNSIGRFLPVDTPEHHYLHHAHARGAMLLRLPLMVFPWTFAVLPALWLHGRAALRRSEDAAARDRARFVVSSVVPGLLVVGVSATARDIYLLPCLPGLVLGLAALVFDARGAGARPWWAFANARLLWFATLALAAGAWLYMTAQFAVPGIGYTLLLALAAVWATRALRRAPRSPDAMAALATLQVPPLLAVLLVGGAMALPSVNRDQDVYAFVARSAALWPHDGIVVLRHEENVRAALAAVMGSNPRLAEDLDEARRLLNADPSRRLLLELGDDPLTPRARQLLGRLRSMATVAAPAAAARLERGPVAIAPDLDQVAELAGPAGRRYGLYASSVSGNELSPFVDSSLPRGAGAAAPATRPMLSSRRSQLALAGRRIESDRPSHAVPF